MMFQWLFDSVNGRTEDFGPGARVNDIDRVERKLDAVLSRKIVLPGKKSSQSFLPDFARGTGVGWNACLVAVKKRLAAAGVEVEEVGRE